MTSFDRTFRVKTWVVVLISLVVMLSGTLTTFSVIRSAEEREKQALLSRAKIIAAGIGVEELKKLTGTPSDIENPAYQEIKKILTKIKGSQQDTRFVYLMGYKEGNKLFFYVDSEHPSSADYSAPGDIYPDTTPEELQWFIKGMSAVEGPYHDSWGEWVSALVPIIDPVDQKTIAMAGIDIKASLWLENIFRAAIVPALITFSVLLFFFLSLFFIRQIGRYVLELNKNREKIFQDEQQLQTVLENLPLGILLVGVPYGDLIMVNREAERIFCQKPPFQQNYRSYLQNTRLTYENNTPYPLEEFPITVTLNTGILTTKQDIVLHSSQGETINLKATAVPLKSSHGDLKYVVMVVEDMTKERTIKDMESELISITSHQLRAPLISIRWFCELLLSQKAGDFTQQQKDFLEQIYASNKRMIALVNNLLDVSHIESDNKNKFVIEKELINLNDILNPVIAEQSAIAGMKQSKIVSHFSKNEDIMLMADSQKLYQVFQNLINNAIKYSPNNSSIEVGMKKEEGTTGTFYVKDSGIGVPQKQQGRIFDKFFRAENVLDTDTNGTGLGLYIVKAIIEAHGGKIWFESEEEKGTTFYFQLPIVPNT